MNSYNGTSAQAIQQHYDRGADFYRLWLDPSMTYSAGLWAGTTSVEDAQIAKIEHHIAAAHASGAERVLDIGCGWGSALKRLVLDHGVKHAVGLTLSRDQHRVVGELELPNVEVRLEGWADHTPDQPYDAAISIGAFEHFARVDHSSTQKMEAYRGFFRHLHSILKPGARLSLQSIVYGTIDQLDPFITNKIWPESELPHIAEMVSAADKIFEVERIQNDRMDYARTCGTWAETLRQQQPAVEALVGNVGYSDYLRYLKMSAKAFEVGALGLVRAQFVRLP